MLIDLNIMNFIDISYSFKNILLNLLININHFKYQKYNYSLNLSIRIFL